ncbi:MAG TPA: HAMP domain-containing sensor histidine kinase [Nitrososphaeraceae archaeon]
MDVYVNRANEKDQFIYIQITDSCSGIDAEIFHVLFSKFATKSVTGTGLGLFISKGIIEAHGGVIQAENNPDGNGATFRFAMPAA